MRALTILALAANALWLGGLVRLLVEVVARLLPKLGAAAGTMTGPIVFAVVFVVATGVLLWLWRPYRDLIRQTQEDMRVWSGLPARPTQPTRAATSRPAAFWILASVFTPLVVAYLLPDSITAALAMLAGLLLRVALVVVAER